MRIVPWRHGTCVTTMPWHVATLMQQCCNIVATIVATLLQLLQLLQQLLQHGHGIVVTQVPLHHGTILIFD